MMRDYGAIGSRMRPKRVEFRRLVGGRSKQGVIFTRKEGEVAFDACCWSHMLNVSNGMNVST